MSDDGKHPNVSNRFTPTLAICLAGAAAAVVALGIPASSSPADPPTPNASAHVVEIVDFDFSIPASVPAGATVEVANRDGSPHTLTAAGGAFDTGVVAGGGSSTFTSPSDAGSFEVFCALHPSMAGQLTVGA